jgi:hypothetical protein
MHNLFNPKLGMIPMEARKIKLGEFAGMATPTATLVPRLPMTTSSMKLQERYIRFVNNVSTTISDGKTS